jgi:hypothetical protein
MAEKKVEKTAATIIVHRVSEMSPEGKKAVLKWMRKQIAWIDKHGDDLAVTFTARYRYSEGDKEYLYGESTASEGAEDERPGGVAPVVSEGL